MSKVAVVPDRSTLLALQAQMPPVQRAQYLEYKCLELESTFPGRRFVVFTLRDGEPYNLEEFLVTAFFYPRGGEPEVEYRFQDDGQFHHGRIGMVPSRFSHREVFLSIPQKFEFRWGGLTVDGKLSFQPHFGLLIKTRHKLMHRVDGATYCITLKRFQAEFPEQGDRVRY